VCRRNLEGKSGSVSFFLVHLVFMPLFKPFLDYSPLAKDFVRFGLDIPDLGLVSGDSPGFSAAVRLLPGFWILKMFF
jgi:hypothetical protein